MKTIDFSYFIERYIEGEMNQTELKWFMKEIEGNESLQKEILLRKKTDKILKAHDIILLRNKLTAIEKTRKEELVISGKKRTMGVRYAAMITSLVLIGSLLMISFRSQSPEILYNKYFKAYDAPASHRSAESVSVSSFNLAIEFYNRKDFQNATKYFIDFLKSNPGNMESEFLSGMSDMNIRNFPDAKNSLKKVIVDNNNLYVEDAQWYLAMCYIGTSDKDMAKKLLQSIKKSDSIYNKKAGKILRQL
jgi:tetratricopeptide (TPR) repeat protein